MSKCSVNSWNSLVEHYVCKQEASSSTAPFQDVSGSTGELINPVSLCILVVGPSDLSLWLDRLTCPCVWTVWPALVVGPSDLPLWLDCLTCACGWTVWHALVVRVSFPYQSACCLSLVASISACNSSGVVGLILSVHGDDRHLSLPGRATSASLSHHRYFEIQTVNLLSLPPFVTLPATYHPLLWCSQ